VPRHGSRKHRARLDRHYGSLHFFSHRARERTGMLARRSRIAKVVSIDSPVMLILLDFPFFSPASPDFHIIPYNCQPGWMRTANKWHLNLAGVVN